MNREKETAMKMFTEQVLRTKVRISVVVILLLALTTMVMLTLPATGHTEDKPSKGVLSALKEGQSVSVKEVAGRYDITVMPDEKLSHIVKEVGNDYLVVEDAVGLTETRIPVYSIKSIAIVKLKTSK
jgi:hypothetical protein